MTGARLPRSPWFVPMNLIERHYNPGRLGGKATMQEPVHPTVPKVFPIQPLNLSDPCWSGECLGCGKPLISATWSLKHGPVYCTRKCKETHDA